MVRRRRQTPRHGLGAVCDRPASRVSRCLRARSLPSSSRSATPEDRGVDLAGLRVLRRATRREAAAAATRSWCAACATARTPSTTRVRDATRGTARWRATRRTTRAASSPSTATPSATPCGGWWWTTTRKRRWRAEGCCDDGEQPRDGRACGRSGARARVRQCSGDDEVSSSSERGGDDDAFGERATGGTKRSARERRRARRRAVRQGLRRRTCGNSIAPDVGGPEPRQTMRAFERAARARAS